MDSTAYSAMNVDIVIDIAMDMEVKNMGSLNVNPPSMVLLTVHVTLLNCKKCILCDGIGKQPVQKKLDVNGKNDIFYNVYWL